MNVLIIGGGGREHALGWKIAQSPKLDKLYFAPGNGGTQALGQNVDIGVQDFAALAKFAQANTIDLTIVGPDDPLAAGIVDYFQKRKLAVFGPTKAAAQIEASKAFAKGLMRQARVPTAEFQVFDDRTKALNYIEQAKFPIVVKASGLALGKGVYICQNLAEAKQAIDDMMVAKLFGEAGDQIVIEDYLDGQEISVHAITDGTRALMFPFARDHKPIFDGNKGPNTGGMGVIAPVPAMISEQDAHDQFVQPIISALKKDHQPFSGCLYPGLKGSGSDYRVLEYNARFGDPETEVYMRLLEDDLLELLLECAKGHLTKTSLSWRPGFAISVVLASAGYPGSYKKGLEISGIEAAEADPDVVVFHAGTKVSDGKLLTNGGRVLNVTAVGVTLEQARTTAYQAVEKIDFSGKQFRSDIGAGL